MRRAVERYLEDPMAEDILRGSFKAGDKVEVTREGEKLSFKVAAGKPSAKAKKAKG
jgi:ATP-dependent Clp protease ATP-binding subunit ClpC